MTALFVGLISLLELYFPIMSCMSLTNLNPVDHMILLLLIKIPHRHFLMVLHSTKDVAVVSFFTLMNNITTK